MIVTMRHFRTVPGFGTRPGFCAAGGRAWFARHGLSWRDFVRQGIEASQLEAIDDGFCRAILAHARAEVSHGR